MAPDHSPLSAADPQIEAAYRGFLFSDLRGYTAFVESAGNAAAAQLLKSYRDIVRTAVARHGGAEIKTEGDSFYVVFPSATSAVLCGLGIVKEAAQAARSDPEHPIEVAIGIHAGETVATEEGFVGVAVNVAARICAQASAGEVLVSETVRTLARSNVPVHFRRRGKRQLKGVSEPVSLYRVEPAATEVRAAPVVTRGRASGAGIGLAAIVSIIAVVLLSGAGAAPSSSPASQPIVTGVPTAGQSTATARAASAAQPSATVAGGSVVPETTVPTDVFPNAAEQALLSRLPTGLGEDCRRERVVLFPTRMRRHPTHDADHLSVTPAEGIKCDLPLGQAARTLWLRTYPSVSTTSSQLASLAAIQNATELGDCRAASNQMGTWRVGDRRIGTLVCWGGDVEPAWVAWSYEQAAMIATAVNDAGDMEALVRWWLSMARYLDR